MSPAAAAPTTVAEWNAYYAGAEHPYCWAACGPLITAAAAIPVGRAVDIGCGCGRHARALADLGWRVEAIDYSSAAIEIARAGGDTDLIDYQLADACWWHPHSPVQLVVIAYPTLAPNALNALLARAAGWITAKGMLLYVGDTPTEGTRTVLATEFSAVDVTAADPRRGAPAIVRVRGAKAAEAQPPRPPCGSVAPVGVAVASQKRAVAHEVTAKPLAVMGV